MTIQRRSHPHQGPALLPPSTEEAFKEHPAPLRRKVHRWSYSQIKDEAVDWLLLVTCAMVLFVCTLWFMGKVMVVFSWFLPTEVFSSTNHHINPVNHYKYAIPHAHKTVGDRSLEYSLLREEIDSTFPEDAQRSLQRVQELQIHSHVQAMPTIDLDHNSDQVPKIAYDIYNCPPTPPPGYPYQWKLLQLVDNWNPENTTVPSHIFNSLCTFDYEQDYEKAMAYRNAEVPFVMKHDPRIAATAERWNAPGYMQRLLGSVKHRTTHSDTNHFLYAIPPPKNPRRRKHLRRTAPPGWKEPTEALRMTYSEWLKKANVTDEQSLPDQPHWYYRLIGCGLTGPDGSCDQGSTEALFDELPFFQPTTGGLYLRDAEKQKGIHCRFGQKGIVADNHFDAGRNTIVVLGGSRR